MKDGYIFEFLHDMYDFRDKKKNLTYHIDNMLNRSMTMFRWLNLPDTIDEKFIELYLQTEGCCFFTKVNEDYYVFFGGLGGKPDVYYFPTIFTVANPALNYSANCKIGEDGILITNDEMLTGLLPIYRKYGSLQVELDLSKYLSIINTRIVNILSVADDSTKASAEKYLKDIEDGKLGVIGDSAFLDLLKIHAGADQRDNLVNLIEETQYDKASELNEIGLQANYNMKRESINSNEAQLNEDFLYPLIDNMLLCRKRACQQINEMYGLDIDVEFNSSWQDNYNQLQSELEAIKAENEKLIAEAEKAKAEADNVDNVDNVVDNSESIPDPNNSLAEDNSENTTDDSEPEIEDQAPEESEPVEDVLDQEEIKEDIEEIKEDIQDIKENLLESEEDEETKDDE